jgi:NADH:ubiquinone oxidoreductase subunit 6 (subunit J)
MDFMKNFPIIALAFAFIIVSANWVAIQLKIYALLYPISIIALVGTIILLLIFFIEFYKLIKRIKKENTNLEKI